MKDNSMKLKAKKMAIMHFKDMIKNAMKEDSMPDMEKLMANRPNKMLKVSVAADSKEGLKKGLSKAEEILKAKMEDSGEMPEEESKMEDMMSEEEPSEEEEYPEEDMMESPEGEESMEEECECPDPENCNCGKSPLMKYKK